MRVVWRDTYVPEEYKILTYRGIELFGTPDGWTLKVDDDNLYKNHYCAKNAIDRYLGDTEPRGCAKRQKYGIQIVGKKSDLENKGA